jgi:PAS domain S-box-containing protein
MLDCLSEGFFAIDRQWQITYINRWLEEKLIIKREDYLGRDLWECFAHLQGTEYEEMFKEAVSRRVTVKFERFSLIYNCWFEVAAHPSSNGLSVFLRDITERKHAQEELRLSNERFRLAAKTDAIYDWNLTTNYLHWGEGLQEIFGYFSEEMQINQWAAALHPEDEQWLIKDLYQTLDNPTATLWKCEYQFRKKDGVFCYVYERGHIIRDVTGKAVRMVGVMHNITSRKLAEEELRRLSLIAQKTVNAVFVTDTHHRIVWTNDAFTSVFEYSFEEAEGKIPSELLDCEEADPETLALMRQKALLCEGFHVQVMNQTKSGRYIWCDSSYQPVHNERGELIQYFCIITDLTECKTLEHQLDDQRRKTTAAVIKAQERERAQVGRELHDNVNQVLTTVKLYQDLIASGMGDRSELTKKSALLLQQSIDEIRSLSKRLSAPTLGNIRLRDSVTELLFNIAATNRFELIHDCCVIEELDVTEELHLAVFRILQEQLTNILKYAEATLVNVSFNIDNTDLVLIIVDNGKGFNIKQKRSGIGITNMMMRAESLDGTLVIQSAIGQGCTLTASFPLQRK